MLKMLAFTFLIVLIGSFTIAADHSEVTERTFTTSGTPELVLRNPDGVIHIYAHDEPGVKLKITRQVHGAKDEAHARKELERISLELDQMGDQIRAITRWGNRVFHLGGGPSITVRYEIHTPKKTNVRAEVSDGEMFVSGLTGSIELNASDGEIVASDLSGELRFRASDGNIDLKRNSGTMDIVLSDGDLRAEGCNGRVRIQSGDGRVELPGFTGEAEVSNGDGDVLIDGKLSGLNGRSGDGEMVIIVAQGSVMQSPWSLRSGDGEIMLELPDDFSADLEITTGDGRVQTDHPVNILGRLSSRNLSGKIGNGGQLLQIKTGDGHIAIK